MYRPPPPSPFSLFLSLSLFVCLFVCLSVSLLILQRYTVPLNLPCCAANSRLQIKISPSPPNDGGSWCPAVKSTHLVCKTKAFSSARASAFHFLFFFGGQNVCWEPKDLMGTLHSPGGNLSLHFMNHKQLSRRTCAHLFTNVSAYARLSTLAKVL